MIGNTISHYRIIQKLGQGGMGEVFLAEDTNLNRQVALKVLPEAFSGDPERLARFEREAKLLASLNHPNIAAIHGLEQADGKRFIVLELVEGETLAQRIAKGALRVDEALEVCRQIAEGLEAAHEKGIIHRDLKPANVKITPEGKIKVLDFGLAKAFHEEQAAADATRSPMITDQMTRPGVILGTAAYMSPEQARGKPADKRADIWAFGCILYECLTGKRAFEGETITETLAAVLEGEPDWQALPATATWKVKDLLHRCLQKDPRDRLHDIADARIEIGEAAAGRAFPVEAAPAIRRFSLPWLITGAAVVLLAGIVIGLALMTYFQPAPSTSAVTSTIEVEPGYWLDGMRTAQAFQRPSRTAMVISSDGSFVIYSAVEENPAAQAKPRLYLRRLDQPEAKPMAGTEGGIQPFLSPDNRWVGFWADGKLKKKQIDFGLTTVLCDASAIFGASWGRDNSILFSDGSADIGLARVSAGGGKPEVLTKPDPKQEEGRHCLPFWLPNERAVIFTVMRHGWDRQPWLALLRMDTREWRVLLQDAADARYVPTGHLVFLRQGVLMGVRFDLAKLEIVGPPVALKENVMQAFSTGSSNNTSAGQFTVSDAGLLCYAQGGLVPDPQNTLVWVDQKGAEQPATPLRFPFFAPRLSPDGKRIAYYNFASAREIWVFDIEKGTNNRVTGEQSASAPIWTPDGKRLIFRIRKGASLDLFWQPYDGSSPMEALTSSGTDKYVFSSSPDGKSVVLAEWNPVTRWDISILDMDSRRVTPFLNSQFNEECPDLSPDGRWIAYASNESKRREILVRSFPEAAMKYPVSSEGGYAPLWTRDGKRIFYRWQDQVWVVDVQTTGGFTCGKPHLLFEKSGFMMGGPLSSYDVSLDSQRLLMVKAEQRKPAPVTEMILVQNWFEELKRLVPTGK